MLAQPLLTGRALFAAAMLGETLMMRLWLSNMNVGTVIGKGGANIKSIREKSSCRVSISEHVPHAPERMMTVTGSAQSLNTVIEMMLDAIEEAQAQHKASKAAENPEAAEAAAGEEAKETTHNLKLVMSNNQAGGIIGKAGANIKAMREESGAFIKVDASGTGGGPYDRLVIVNGTKASLIKAHLLLMFKVAPLLPLPPYLATVLSQVHEHAAAATDVGLYARALEGEARSKQRASTHKTK